MEFDEDELKETRIRSQARRRSSRLKSAKLFLKSRPQTRRASVLRDDNGPATFRDRKLQDREDDPIRSRLTFMATRMIKTDMPMSIPQRERTILQWTIHHCLTLTMPRGNFIFTFVPSRSPWDRRTIQVERLLGTDPDWHKDSLMTAVATPMISQY